MRISKKHDIHVYFDLSPSRNSNDANSNRLAREEHSIGHFMQWTRGKRPPKQGSLQPRQSLSPAAARASQSTIARPASLIHGEWHDPLRITGQSAGSLAPEDVGNRSSISLSIGNHGPNSAESVGGSTEEASISHYRNMDGVEERRRAILLRPRRAAHENSFLKAMEEIWENPMDGLQIFSRNRVTDPQVREDLTEIARQAMVFHQARAMFERGGFSPEEIADRFNLPEEDKNKLQGEA